MGKIKVNQIENHDANQVELTAPLQIKSYSTTDRDALSSPQAGWIIYNSTTNKLNQYNGSAWTEVGGGASIGMAIALGE